MLAIGIVGLPNVGKSTLFNALTKNKVLAANYPFATIEPNTGIVPLPDSRLDQLAALYDSQKIIPAPVTFVDIAGLVRGASEGQGLGNQFLANIRETDGIVQVVRVFQDDDVLHVEGKIDPESDIKTINTELILADLQTLNKRAERLAAEAKKDPKTFAPMQPIVEAASKLLDDGKTLFEAKFDISAVTDLQLLTTKPFIYVFNLDEDQLADVELRTKYTQLIAPAKAVFLCAQIESELQDLSADEAHELLESLGQKQSGLAQLASVGFEALGLQTFLTAGPKESRAWTIPRGATAPEAAGVIHTDFQRGFIRAEVINWKDLVDAGSIPAAKSKGLIRSEGKEYVMRDGDVVEFRFNV